MIFVSRVARLLPWILALAALGACEEPLADGTRPCSPEEVEGCPDGYVCRKNTCRYGSFYCYRRQAGDRESYAEPVCVVDGHCEERACESRWNCREDCGVHCDIETLTSQPASDVLVAEYFFPETFQEYRATGTDLDGDGEIDNKIGAIVSLLASIGMLEDLSEAFASRVQAGELLVVARLWTEGDSIAEPQQGVAQLLIGESVDATPLFDGSDTLRSSSESSTDSFLCGVLSPTLTFRSDLSTGPLRLPLPLVASGGGVFLGTFAVVQVEGPISPEGWLDVNVGGGVTLETLREELFPWLVSQMNREIQRDPGSRSSAEILDVFDDKCEFTLLGCDPLPQGCLGDGLISTDELRCNALLDSATAPDVDLDGDGEMDVLSVGFRIVSTVPVTLLE